MVARFLLSTLPAFLLLMIVPSAFVFAVQQGDTSTLTITGTVVDAPQCTVNGNGVVTVNFGDDVEIHKLDGVSYKKTKLEYKMVCTGLAKPKLKVSVTGQQAGFGSGLIYTNRTGLGIQLYHDSTPLNTGVTTVAATQVNFDYDGPGSEPLLYAVPVAQDGTRLTAGDFSGNGTLVIAYQ
ncbi:fimbrial protein [Kluyvera intermedia]|uniref:fimbrial protein n=1 Tax=Kluyvera intermedia TaxID=61648 RepID=UPI0007896D5F|nr:fimbrial protein [Kluyvera intermedia]WQD29270.1 fimbrial protein [Kluyvera intermedia]VDZ85066.1 putative minor fimbrial subunit StfE [Kluyvera intermedia]